MIDLNSIGSVLKQKRQEKGITQETVAKQLGLTRNHVSDIERGIHKITIQVFCGYCEILDITPNDLLEVYNKDEIIPELNNYLSNLGIEEQRKILSIVKLL